MSWQLPDVGNPDCITLQVIASHDMGMLFHQGATWMKCRPPDTTHIHIPSIQFVQASLQENQFANAEVA